MSRTPYFVEAAGRFFDVFDADGLVASFGFDRDDERWWVVAETKRFTTTASLPAALGGYFYREFATRAEIERLFGLTPPPSEPVAAFPQPELSEAA